MSRVWVVLLGLLVGVGTAQAVTRYVDNAIGDCAGTYNPTTRACSGGSAQSWNTVQECVNAMAAGDTCSIRGPNGTGTVGTYPERVLFALECSAGDPCVLTGHAGDTRPILRPDSTDGEPIIQVFRNETAPNPAHLTIKDFTLDGINQPVNSGGIGVYMNNVTVENMIVTNISRSAIGGVGVGLLPTASSDTLTVRNNQIFNCGRIQPGNEVDTKGIGIYLQGANNLVEGNLIDGCRSGGVEVNYDENVGNIIRNNIVRNAGCSSPWGCISSTTTTGTPRETNPRCVTLGGAGTTGPNGPTNNLFYNNRCSNIKGTNNQGTCFGFWGSQNNTLANNTCYNVDHPITTALSTNTSATIRNNIYALMSGANVLAGTLTGTQSNNLTNPPVATTFVNAGSGDFHLLSTATGAIDQGVTVAAVTVDADGVSRPQNGVYDIGAYEFVGGDTTPPNAPATLTVTVLDTGRTTLTWPASTSTDETGYRLYRCTGTSCTTGSTIHVTLGNVLTYTDLNLDANTVYGYQVSAIDAVPNESSKTTIQYGTTDTHPASALVAHYPFEEGTGTAVDDASTHDHDGILLGTPQISHWASGTIGTWALRLDGDDDALEVPNATQHDVVQRFTVMGYFNPIQAMTSWNAGVVKNYAVFLYASAAASVTNPCGNGAVVAGFLNYNSSAFRTVCHATPLPINAWTHLAVTYDGTTLRLWRDYVEVGTPLSTTDNVLVTTGPLHVGRSQYGEFFPGRIDQVKMYNYARSQAEIASEAADVTAPDAPTNLTLTVISPVQIDATWTAAFDAVGVTNYTVYSCSGSGCTPANPVTIGNVTSTSLTGLTASTLYRVQVSALDAATNESTRSTPIQEATTSATAAGVTFIGEATINSITGGDSTNFIGNAVINSIN